jgi:ABC-type dipeptide/oligopeptide/nickel transport system permease component
MTRHIVHRLVLAVPVLFGVLLIGFVLMQVVPTDPATVRAGPMATPDVIQAIRAELGLDRPLWMQFLIYLGNVLSGDLGRSIISNMDVGQELMAAIGPTTELMVACLIWATPLGVALGTIAAARRGGLVDRAVMAVSVVGLSVPIFFVGLLLIWFIGFKLQWLPFTGRPGPLWSWDGLQGIVLPSITLGSVFIGPVARMTRTSVVDVLGQDFIRTARAKGLAEPRVVLRHALRNALVPVVTLIGLQIGFLLGGAVVTETLFAWPGVGRLAVGAILSSDLPVAQGAIILLSLAFILINLAVDVLYAYLDPRIRHG